MQKKKSQMLTCGIVIMCILHENIWYFGIKKISNYVNIV